MSAPRRAATALIGAVTLVATAGCAVTVDRLPLPKPGIDEGYPLTAVFDDALNLPERAHVKIGGTDIGVVTAISTADYQAKVELSIRPDITLPRGTQAELRQATPLGDIFVAITLPQREATTVNLRPGDTIGTEFTSAGASVEDLMVSVSMLLNGGGLQHLARISTELDSMFGGRGPQLAHLLTEITATLDALNRRTADIDALLVGMNSLTGELNSRKAELGAAAEQLPALIGVLAENNQSIGDLVARTSATMGALGEFADTSTEQTTQLLQSVSALMAGFSRMGDDLAGTLAGLHTVHPRFMAGFDGPALSVAATLSALDIGAITDATGSRWPDGSDVPAFIGSLSDVLAKVQQRLQGGGR